jgi:hypothetical protein
MFRAVAMQFSTPVRNAEDRPQQGPVFGNVCSLAYCCKAPLERADDTMSYHSPDSYISTMP